MTKQRFEYLKNQDYDECLSLGELIEISAAYNKIAVGRLRDIPTNAQASDMLDEIEDNGEVTP